MDRRVFVLSMLALAAESVGVANGVSRRAAFEPDAVFEPDLAGIVEGKGWQVFNRDASLFNRGAKRGVRFDERAGDGVALLKGYTFKTGTIEFDVKGRNVLQKSFVGIAFNVLDETTYDAVYFRPFNFRSDDPLRRSHAVQYISPPTHTWRKLRSEYPGKYEQPVSPVPDPEEWFHARVVVSRPKVSVFVNDATAPSLVVEQLSERKQGRVGLWAGDGSGGYFANLRIIPDR